MFNDGALTKAQIRQHVREELHRLQDDERHALSESIQQQILELPAWQQAATVMLYMHMPHEVATDKLIDHLQKAGRSFVVPKCQGDHIIPCRIKDPATDLAATAWGLREPRDQLLTVVDPNELDFVLVPGVAFDRQGNRIGYGRGYYDRFLRELSDHTYILPIAFSRQVVERCPSEAFDYRVPRLLTEKGLMSFGDC